MTYLGLLMGALVYSWPLLAQFRWQFNGWALLAAVALFVVAILFAVVAWSRILRYLGVGLPLREHARIYCLTLAAARLPGAPWHWAGRAVLYETHGLSKRLTTLASGFETALIVLSGVIVSAMFSPSIAWQVTELGALSWPILAVLVGIAVLVQPRVLKAIVARLGIEESVADVHYAGLLFLIVFYGMIWVVGGFLCYFLALSIFALSSDSIPTLIASWAVSGALSVVLSLTPSGFGVREISFTLLAATIMPIGVAAILSVVLRLFLTGLEVMAGGIASCWQTDVMSGPAH
jgi:uncharacterized membrane protein YbhN (UPF0104 family)